LLARFGLALDAARTIVAPSIETEPLMIAAAIQAFLDLFSPPFRSVALKCVAFTILLLVALIVAIEWMFGHFVSWPTWIQDTVQVMGGLALVIGSMFLIPPVSSLIAGLYLDDIALAVERSQYPDEPPGRPMSLATSVSMSLKFFAIAVAVNLVVLMLLLVPGINLIAFYLGNGYLFGREFFEMVAMRYLSAAETRTMRRQNNLHIFICGLIITCLASVPILNLLTPLFATAFMVHIYKRIAFRERIGVAPA
jgi:CysZ protein